MSAEGGELPDLVETLTQVNALRAQGLSADDAAARVDMTKYSSEFPAIRAPGIDPAAVRRIYKLATSPEPAN